MPKMSTTTAKRPGRTLQFARLSLLAIALGLATFGLAACKGGGANGPGGKSDPKTDKGPEAVPVEVAAASQRSISASYSGTAALEARGDAQVVSKTSGIALKVLVDVGQHVTAGQTLVSIDRDRAVLQQAQADAQVRKLEANYRRATQLAEQKMVSANDVDQLRFDLDNARAQLRMAKLELAYGNVTAPISGVVSTRDIKPGNFVQINTPIFTIVDTSRLEATFQTRAVPSLLELMRRLPSGLNATVAIASVCPAKVNRACPVRASQT